MYNYFMPKNIDSGLESINKLINMHLKIKEIAEKEIMIDFSSTKWMSGECFALFGALTYDLTKRYNKKLYINGVSEELRMMFESNNFSEVVSNMKSGIIKETSIKFEYFKKELEQGKNNCFDVYLEKELTPKINLSKQEIDYIISKLSELFINARTHGNTFDIFCCGQKYPKINKLKLIIVDLGKGIPYNVKKKIGNIPDYSCIEWAIEAGNTTKDLTKDSGGLGLDAVLEFVKQHNGDMSIISHLGQYNYKNNILKDGEIELEGTLVYIEFDYTAIKDMDRLFEKIKRNKEFDWNF